jgi:succinate-acetate transporter protein
MYNGHLVSPAGEPVIFPMLLLYGGIAQFIGGMWEFRTGNTFAAVTFGSYGAFWVGLWLLLTHYLKLVPAGGVSNHALGLFLWTWALFTTMLFVASLRTNLAVVVTVALLVIVEIILPCRDGVVHDVLDHPRVHLRPADPASGLVGAAVRLEIAGRLTPRAQRRWVKLHP